jgi:hypothetical protein
VLQFSNNTRAQQTYILTDRKKPRYCYACACGLQDFFCIKKEGSVLLQFSVNLCLCFVTAQQYAYIFIFLTRNMPKRKCKFRSHLEKNFLASKVAKMKMKQNVLYVDLSCPWQTKEVIIWEHMPTVSSTRNKSQKSVISSLNKFQKLNNGLQQLKGHCHFML